MSQPKKRIIITGGSGLAGREVIHYLLDAGYDILNLDLVPLPQDLSSNNDKVHTLRTDLTDSGQVFNAISSNFHLTQPFREPLLQPPDAVIHLAGHARNMLVPDNETFRVNVQSTYNVIEASCKLGVKKIIIASSVTTYGVTFAQGDVDWPGFPVDETMETNPSDAYGMSKICCENVARGFALRYGIDVYALRLGHVVTPTDHERAFQAYVEDASLWKGHGWSYIDARDLGQICDLCIRKNGLGYQVLNAVNDEITNFNNTEKFLRKQCPNTPIVRVLGEHEAPISNQKSKQMLGFQEAHSWRKYYRSKDGGAGGGASTHDAAVTVAGDTGSKLTVA